MSLVVLRPTRLPALPGALALGSLPDAAAHFAAHLHAVAAFPPAEASRRALDALAFSLRHGHADLSVPTKLVGTARHADTLEHLADAPGLGLLVAPSLAVFVRLRGDVVRPLGHLQAKHARWLAPLLPHGVALSALAVTGRSRRAQGLPATLGLNVRLHGLADALRERARAEPARNSHETRPRAA